MESRKGVALLDQLILLGVIALAVLTPLVYSGYAFLLKHTFTHLVVTLIFGLWLLKGIAVGRIDNPRPQLLLPFSVLILVSVLSLVKAINLEAGIREVYRLSIYTILYFVVVEILLEKDRWRIIAGSMALGGVLTCLVGFYQFVNPGSFSFWGVGGQFIGLIGNRTYIGAYLLTLIPLCIALYFFSDSWVEKVAWGLVLAFLNVSIVLARSRAAWLGLAFGLCLMIPLMQKHKALQAPSYKAAKAKKMLAVLAILVSSWGMGILLFSRGDPSQTALFQARGDFSSLQYRISYWWDSLNMIRENPLLGVGAGNFTFVFFRYADLPQGPFTQNTLLEHPHNEYINLTAELGALGLLAFSWLLLRIGRMGWQALKKAEETEEALRLLSLLGCLVSVAINGFLFYPFHEPSTTLNLFLILGLLEATFQGGAKKTRNGFAGQIGFTRLIRQGAIGLMIFGALAALFYRLSFRPLLASYYFVHGVNHFVQGKYGEGIRDAERSISWDRRSFLPRFLLAQNYFRMGRFSEAIHESEKLLQLHPYILYPFDMIATSYIALRQPSKTMETYARALEVNPKLTTALVNLGSLYLKEKKYEKAKELFERGISASPERPEAYLNLGLLHRELGQLEEALAFYREAVRLDPSLPHAWYAIAGLEARAGRISESLRALARAFSLNTAFRDQAKTDAAFDTIRNHERFRRIVGR
ncbi:MAG: tetratricopeptide repeat protein [Candidatus Methylomirabilales bacterium]